MKEESLSLGLVLALINKISIDNAASYAAVGVLSITGASDGSGLVVKYTDGRPDSTIPFVNIMTTTVYDTNGNGIVDNSEKLNGQDASYYLDSLNSTFSDTTLTATNVSDAIKEVYGQYATLDGLITAINNDIVALTTRVGNNEANIQAINDSIGVAGGIVPLNDDGMIDPKYYISGGEVGGTQVIVDGTSVSTVSFTSDPQTQINSKQDELISGTNIKTINGESLLGSGDIVISGGGGSGDVTTAEFEAYKDEVTAEFEAVNTRIDGIETGSGFVSQEDFDEFKEEVEENYVTTGDSAGTTEGSNILVADALSSSEGNKTFDDIKALIDAGGGGGGGCDCNLPDDFYDETTQLVNSTYIDGYTKEVIDEKFNNIETDDFSSDYEVISAVFDIPANEYLEVTALDGIDLRQYSPPIISTTNGINVAWANRIYVGNNTFHVRNLSSTSALSGGYLSAKKQKGIAVEGGGESNLPDDFYDESTSLVNSTYIDAYTKEQSDEKFTTFEETSSSETGEFEVVATSLKLDNGTTVSAQTFNDRLTSLETEFETITDEFDTAIENFNTLNTKVDTFDSRIIDTETQMSTLTTNVSDLDTKVETFDSRITDNETNITTLTTNIETLTNDVATLKTSVEAFNATTEALSDRITTLEENHVTFEATGEYTN